MMLYASAQPRKCIDAESACAQCTPVQLTCLWPGQTYLPSRADAAQQADTSLRTGCAIWSYLLPPGSSLGDAWYMSIVTFLTIGCVCATTEVLLRYPASVVL